MRALELFPKSSSMHLKYAGFLRHTKTDMKGAEEHYKIASEVSDENADAIGNYASFMHGVVGDMYSAEALYERAVKVSTKLLCN